MNSPITWFGGKGLPRLRNRLLSRINMREHKVYVEPFGGGASVLLAKKPSELEVYNDINHALYEFFTVLSDPILFEQFYRRVSVLPFSRELYKNCHETWKTEKDIIARVSKWFVIARQSFGGKVRTTWKFSVSFNQCPSTWLGCLDKLPQVHSRLQSVQIDCLDWKKIFERYDSKDALFYCDPPYVHETRKLSINEYEHEMSDEDHKDFVCCLLGIKGQAVVSGYEHVIYNKLVESGWEKYKIGMKTNFPSEDKNREEIVWATSLIKSKIKTFF